MTDVTDERRTLPERSFADHVVERGKGPLSRLYYGETAIDFVGRRWRTLGLSILLVVIACGSLLIQRLDLGIDFEGGVAWDVPSTELSADEVRTILSEHGLDGSTARVQERTSAGQRRIQAEVVHQDPATREAVQDALAAAAGLTSNDVTIKDVSERWGDHITRQAAQALVVFIALVLVFIAIRFDWRMSVAAIVAMLHDLVIAVGVYSVFQLLVTPATVIAFLTILGFSLYDTLVVFDKIRENREAYSDTYLNVADVCNVSMNQVLGRSLNTTVSSLLPVGSLLVVGAWIFGAVTLREFALALLIGMLVGTYSSIFVAMPLFAMISRRTESMSDRATGAELRRLVMGGAPVSHRESNRLRAAVRAGGDDAGSPTRPSAAKESKQPKENVSEEPDDRATPKPGRSTAKARRITDDWATGTDDDAAPDASAGGADDGSAGAEADDRSTEQLLQHAPRPRKKKRR